VEVAASECRSPSLSAVEFLNPYREGVDAWLCWGIVSEHTRVYPKYSRYPVKFINLTTKCVWKLPMSTQLRAIWHTDSLDMVVLPTTGASCYHNCCGDGGTSPEYFGYTLVMTLSEGSELCSTL
jgi:hypothetical protein